jgi:hypothetical protein
MLEAVGVLPVAAIRRAAGGLDIGDVPRVRPQRPQGGGGVESSRAHLHIVGLENHASLLRPVALQREDNILKCEGFFCCHGVCALLRSRTGSMLYPKTLEKQWSLWPGAYTKVSCVFATESS